MWWRKTERTDKRDGCPDPRGARVFTLQQASEWDTLDEWSSTKQFFFFQDCKVKPAAAGIRSFSQIKALYILVDFKKKKAWSKSSASILQSHNPGFMWSEFYSSWAFGTMCCFPSAEAKRCSLCRAPPFLCSPPLLVTHFPPLFEVLIT